MKPSCRDLGCRYDTQDLTEAVYLVCLDCGHQEYLPKRSDGTYDRFKEVRLNTRDLIQPYEREKWENLQKHEEIVHFSELAKLKERNEHCSVQY